MRARRLFGSLSLAAGLGLCLAAGFHYLRGSLAQRQALADFRRLAARPPSATAAPTLRQTARENPGIVSSSAPAPPAASVYPYGQPIARIRIPSAKIDAIVFAGSDQATLEKGPGHVPGTALPGAEGPPNNCVITGHRDSHFRHLGWPRPGHTIELEIPSASRTYRIIEREIVKPDAVSVLAPTETPLDAHHLLPLQLHRPRAGAAGPDRGARRPPLGPAPFLKLGSEKASPRVELLLTSRRNHREASREPHALRRDQPGCRLRSGRRRDPRKSCGPARRRSWKDEF